MYYTTTAVIMTVLSLDLCNHCFAGDTFEFEPVQFYMTVSSPGILLTTEANSLVHCASLCWSTQGCLSFDFQCQSLLQRTKGICNILGNSITSVSELVASSQCFVQINGVGGALPAQLPPLTTTVSPIPTTTTPIAGPPPYSSTTTTAATTDTTTTASDLEIKGLLHSAVVYASDSYILFTKDGLYIYEHLADLYGSGPISGPHSLEMVFPGYSSLPSLDVVKCIMNSYFSSRTEIYTSAIIYLWDNLLNNIYSNPITISDTLGTQTFTTMALNTINWCVAQNWVSHERIFAYTDFLQNKYILATPETYSNGFGGRTDPIQINGQDVNGFKGLPTDVVAVANHHSNYDNLFVVIGGNYSVYEYEYSQSDVDDTILTYKGQLVV